MERVTRILRTGACIAVMVCLLPTVGMAQTDAHQHDQKPAGEQSTAKQTGQMKMGAMKSMDEMAARKKANTVKIDAVMGRMKEANADGKIAAMADVIAILLEERAAMQEHCAGMHEAKHK
jgi:hypothetical protein